MTGSRIRAAQERSPLIRLLDLHANRPDSWEIEGLPAEDPAKVDGETATDDGETSDVNGAEPEGVAKETAKEPGGSVAHAVGAPPTAAKPAYAAPEGGGDATTGTQDGTSDQPVAKPEGSGTQDGTSDGGSAKPTTQDGTTGGSTSDETPTPGKPGTSDKPDEPDEPDKPDEPDDCPPLSTPTAPDSPPRLVLDGLTIAGRSVRISGQIGMVVDPPLDARSRLVARPGLLPDRRGRTQPRAGRPVWWPDHRTIDRRQHLRLAERGIDRADADRHQR